MNLDSYLETRPFAWHLTSARNLARLRETRVLECTHRLMRHAGMPAARDRRETSQTIRVEHHEIVIRDQEPLHRGHIGFEDGWDFARLLAHLDSHVFFWPGTADKPVDSGQRHFARYLDASESLAFLRVDARALIAQNPAPHFSACNSGSPRTTSGRPSPRGSQTFVRAEHFDRVPSKVIELVFVESASLPSDTLVASSPSGPWDPLV